MRRQAEAGGGRVKVLVACEFSGIVRDAFRARGQDAVSCDLLGCERDSAWHITGDVFKAIRFRGPWDMMIAFPPCTHIAVSGARWFKNKLAEQRAALEFMRDLLEANIPKIAVENPIGIFSTYWRKPDQIIQPWQFGHGETKATCLWLRGLPKLTPTKIVDGRKARVHREPPSPDRWKNRSRTYQGIADAMAEQWSPHEPG
jgi:site-specific DNA-cytosine methylase